MTAAVRDIAARVDRRVTLAQAASADRWGLVHLAAAAIPHGTNLSDPAAVLLALLRWGFLTADVGDALDEITTETRLRRSAA